MRRGLFTALAVALVLATIAGWAAFAMASVSTAKWKGEAETTSAQLETASRDLEQDKSTLVQVRADLDTVQTEMQASLAMVTTVEAENKSLEADKTRLQSQYNELRSRLFCASAPVTVDFAGNESVTKALTDYVKRVGGELPITAHYWNTIWTGDKYSVHTVEQLDQAHNTNFVWKFTAYFRGEANGEHKNGVFYNDGQCWLYLED